MAKSYAKAKGRSAKEGAFVGLPHKVVDSESFRLLSGAAVKILIRIVRQYNGHNNGDLCAPASYASALGIGSETTWYRAIKELIAADLIVCTRDPVRNRQNPHGQCSLYALTWRGIDECNGKLDIKPNAIALRKF